MRYANTQSLRMLDFADSTVGYKNWHCFISIKFDVEKKWIICRNFIAGVAIFFKYTNNFSKSRIQYLWQVDINVCKVLVPIKVLLVKNNYFLHKIIVLHRYQQMNGFLYWCSFYWKKFGAYISHEFIVRVISTCIWDNLLTVSQF